MAEEQKKQVRVLMWAIPRSLSTALFRAMWNKKSCKCSPEPYAMAFFFGPERVVNWYPEVPPIDGFDFKSIKKEVYECEYEEEEVFMKDFPAYIYRQKLYDPKELIPDGYVNMFLIRQPRPCIESGYRVFEKKVLTGFTEWDSELVGFKQLWELYNIIKEKQPNPLVIHADDLMNNPEGTLRLICERTGLKFEQSMVNWSDNDGLKEKMEAAFPFLKPLTETVLSTKELKKENSQTQAPVHLPAEIEKDVEENNVYYEKLLPFATRVPAAQ